MTEVDSIPIIPVLLSGGTGKRLWPLSRTNYPKQFLRLYNSKTLIQNTVLRCAQIAFLSKPILVGNINDRFTISSQLAEIKADLEAIILEPLGHNTAPAITLAALFVSQHVGDALILAMPVDHLIQNIETFSSAIEAAKEFALQDKIVIFGIKPCSADSNYGYIEINKSINQNAYSVKSFIEKPNEEEAKEFIAQGRHYWNAGIFLFKASRILQELELFQPEILACCKQAIKRAKFESGFIKLSKETYKACPSISLDYAVLEKSKDLCMLPLNTAWNDIGNWQALYALDKKDKDLNVIHGNVLALDTQNSYIRSENTLVATLGIKDCYIIEARDAILIADKNHLNQINQLRDLLEKTQRTEANSSSLVYRPWGYYLVIEASEHYQIKKIVISPGQSISLQEHQHRSEHWVILKGKATVTLGHENFLLHPNDSIFVPIGVKHRIKNEEESALEFIEIQTGLYLGEDDIKRFEDYYQRELDEV